MTEICVRCERIINDNKTMCLDCYEWAKYHVEINSYKSTEK